MGAWTSRVASRRERRGYATQRPELQLPAPSVVVAHGVWESRVRVTPPTRARLPCALLWARGDGGATSSTGVKPVQTADGEYILPPGVYTVQCVDAAARESAPQSVDVRPLAIPIVRSYCTEPATTDTSRDGRVMVIVENLPRDGRLPTLVWSTGHRTTRPVLENVRAGEYTAVVVAIDGAPTSCMHACAPAVVGIGRAAGPAPKASV